SPLSSGVNTKPNSDSDTLILPISSVIPSWDTLCIVTVTSACAAVANTPPDSNIAISAPEDCRERRRRKAFDRLSAELMRDVASVCMEISCSKTRHVDARTVRRYMPGDQINNAASKAAETVCHRMPACDPIAPTDPITPDHMAIWRQHGHMAPANYVPFASPVTPRNKANP